MDIIEATYNLLDTLDNSDIIKNITISKEIILKDNNLLSKIKEYNSTSDNVLKLKIKKELYNNEYYKKYIENYNELNYIILKINKKYKEYTNTKGSCSSESN